jgi:ABC-2 type transport system permease protein
MNAATACLALAQRDLIQVARSRSQLYSSMFTPLLFLVLLGTGVSRGLEPAALPAGGFTAYLVAGTVVMTAVFSSTFSSASYYRDRDSGLLRVFLSAPHDPRVVLFSKVLSATAIGSLQAGIVLAVASPFVDFEWQYGVGPGIVVAAATILLVNLVLGGLGQALATRVRSMQGFHLVMNLVLFPLLFFSGAFFPVDNLPTWLEILARINPLSYAVDALLLATYAGSGDGFFGVWIDLPILAALALVACATGLARTPALTWSNE